MHTTLAATPTSFDRTLACTGLESPAVAATTSGVVGRVGGCAGAAAVGGDAAGAVSA